MIIADYLEQLKEWFSLLTTRIAVRHGIAWVDFGLSPGSTRAEVMVDSGVGGDSFPGACFAQLAALSTVTDDMPVPRGHTIGEVLRFAPSISFLCSTPSHDGKFKIYACSREPLQGVYAVAWFRVPH